MNLPKQTWRDRFYEKFTVVPMHHETDRERILDALVYPEDVESFIAQILEEEKERLVGEIKKIKDLDGDNIDYSDGQDSVIERVIDLIKK
jgi:hypothetical protein